jgi:hypothetical protein
MNYELEHRGLDRDYWVMPIDEAIFHRNRDGDTEGGEDAGNADEEEGDADAEEGEDAGDKYDADEEDITGWTIWDSRQSDALFGGTDLVYRKAKMEMQLEEMILEMRAEDEEPERAEDQELERKRLERTFGARMKRWIPAGLSNMGSRRTPEAESQNAHVKHPALMLTLFYSIYSFKLHIKQILYRPNTQSLLRTSSIALRSPTSTFNIPATNFRTPTVRPSSLAASHRPSLILVCSLGTKSSANGIAPVKSAYSTQPRLQISDGTPPPPHSSSGLQ